MKITIELSTAAIWAAVTVLAIVAATIVTVVALTVWKEINMELLKYTLALLICPLAVFGPIFLGYAIECMIEYFKKNRK